MEICKDFCIFVRLKREINLINYIKNGSITKNQK